MNRARNLSSLIAILGMTSLLAVACDSGTQEPDAPAAKPMKIENADTTGHATQSEVDPSIPADRFPSDLPDGVVAEVPDTFPEELPIYPGAAPAQGRGVEVEGVPMAALQLLTMDAPDVVYDFYKDKLQNDGWVIEDREDFRGKQAISASNGKCTVSMLVAPTDDGGSDIFLVTEC